MVWGGPQDFPTRSSKYASLSPRSPVLSTSDSRCRQQELYERQSRTPGRPTLQNQRIRNIRLSDCQEEAAHGRTGSKAGKDAKAKGGQKAQNPIERADCTPQRATVILVVILMNPTHVMWVFSGTRPIHAARGIISVVWLKFLPPKCS